MSHDGAGDEAISQTYFGGHKYYSHCNILKLYFMLDHRRVAVPGLWGFPSGDCVLMNRQGCGPPDQDVILHEQWDVVRGLVGRVL